MFIERGIHQTHLSPRGATGDSRIREEGRQVIAGYGKKL